MKTQGDPVLGFLSGLAESDRVRFLALTGSRGGKENLADQFSDYDVVFGVREWSDYEPLLRQILSLGTQVIVQYPDPSDAENRRKFTCLVQFEQFRIDFSAVPVAYLREHLAGEQVRVIADKDAVGSFPEPELDPFTQRAFDECANEFWWVSLYVGKGLARSRFIYAAEHLDILRKQLLRLFAWEYSAQRGESLGKCGLHLREGIGEDDFGVFTRSYRTGTLEEARESLSELSGLFSLHARVTADAYEADYDDAQEDRVRTYLMKRFLCV